jgi:cytoskeletal protein RodZ
LPFLHENLPSSHHHPSAIMNSWIYIGVFSIVVAFVLMQLFKYFVTAPEIAAQDAASKRKNAAKKPQGSTPKTPKKSSDSTPKSQESSSSSQEPAVPKEKKAAVPAAVNSPAQPHPQVDAPKDNKPTKENKPQKAGKEPKGQREKLANSSELKASSGNESDKKKKDKGKKPETEKKPKGDKKKVKSYDYSLALFFFARFP